MRELTQSRFAQLFREAQDTLQIKGVELEKLTGAAGARISRNTISRYRKDTYASGPPDPGKRRLLEQLMDLPSGYFDGVAKADLDEIRKERARRGWSSAEGARRRDADIMARAGTGKTASLIRAQVKVYEEAGELIPPTQVLVWLSLLAGEPISGASGREPGSTSGAAAAEDPRIPESAPSAPGRRRSGSRR